MRFFSSIGAFLLLLTSVSACVPGVSSVGAAHPETLTSTPASMETIQVFFTNPVDSNPIETPKVDAWLVGRIDEAQQSVQMAMYNLTLENVTSALIRAKQRGVNVQVVMESTNMDQEQPERLQRAGIEVLGDRRESLMHHKFLIIDQSLVCSGSLNLTIAGLNYDYNNFVCFLSEKLSQDFAVEFREMFTEDVFGDELLETPFPFVNLDGRTVEVYFLPDDGAAGRIVELINHAENSINFMAYSFTSDDIGNALRQRAAQGLPVSGVVDESRALSEDGAEYPAFVQAGMQVRLDGSGGLLHHKVLILDGEIVITGSYNFTRSAEENNDENCLIIHDKETARRFQEEFDRIYAAGH